VFNLNVLSKPLLLFFFMSVAWVTPGAAADDSVSPLPEPEWMQVDYPEYDPQGLQDPFVPFVMPEEPVDSVPSLERLRPLTPLERVELGQLKLVGVMQAPGRAQEIMAMVEMPDGKGFVLHKGTRLGSNQGEVVEIHQDRVVVREYIQGPYGLEKTRSILRLRSGVNG